VSYHPLLLEMHKVEHQVLLCEKKNQILKMIDILSTIHLDQTEEEEIQLGKTRKTILIIE
jgi:hypothetical protein